MTSICQLECYTPVVSIITGRTVYINDSPDQYLISPNLDLDELVEVVAQWTSRIDALRPENRPPPALGRAVSTLCECRSREDVAVALDAVLLSEFAAKLSTSSIGSLQRFLVDLMLRLWAANVVAWPVLNQVPFSSPVLTLHGQSFNRSSLSYLKQIRSYLSRGGTDDSANFRFVLDHILSRAGVSEIGDLTPQTFYLTESRCRNGKLRSVGIQAVLSALRDAHYQSTVSWTPEDFGFFLSKMGKLARDSKFGWVTSKDPLMSDWVRLAMKHLETNPKNFKKRNSAINSFLNHYLEHSELPRNPAEYFDIRRRPSAIFTVVGNAGRQTMGIINEFLDEALFTVCAQPNDNEMPVLMPGFANPLPKSSYRNVNSGETHREAMPTRLIKLAAHILTDNDFAWPKKIGRVNDSLRWIDPETGKFEDIWSPVRTYVVLAKLLLPARTYQVRMLDSGEGDSRRYVGPNIWEVNRGPHRPLNAVKPIERGVFRSYRRKDGSTGALFYFNTNKTADIESANKGYVMPWEKQDALELFAKLRDWQEKYNPVAGPTAWTEILELKKVKHADDLKSMGVNFFLFRDPTSKSRPDLPVTDVRVRNLWLKLMDEMERRLAEAGETLDNGVPLKLILSREKNGQPTSAAFDLHSLRVSLITAMYEEGIPPEYLMKIVGHASVIMTLYYTKISSENITLRMNEALVARQKVSQAEMAGFIKRASRDELISAVAYQHPSALDAAVDGTGVGFLVMDHGICPVAARRCHEGLAVIDFASKVTRFQAVPGGASNCARCRFFITGPAFLFGLEAHVNDLAYRLKKASFSYEKAQEKFDSLSDSFAAAVEARSPFLQQRDLEIAETSLEASTAHVDSIALSLQSAYALTEQCIEISSKSRDGDFSLVAVGGTGVLEAVLSESHEFDQLNHICTSATLFDGLNIDWQQPNLERARMFDRMLRNSGHEPRLSLLNDIDSLKISNAMSKFLYARLDSNAVHALIDGRTTLRSVGLDKAFIAQLGNFEPKTLSSLRQSHVLEQG